MPRPLNEPALTRFHHNWHFICHSPWDMLPENHLYTVPNDGELDTALMNRFKMAMHQLYTVMYEQYADLSRANGACEEVEG